MTSQSLDGNNKSSSNSSSRTKALVLNCGKIGMLIILPASAAMMENNLVILQ